MASDNLAECEAQFLDFLETLGFDIPGESGGTLGEEIAQAVAEDIHASDAVNPDGSPWPDNRQPYKARKKRTHGSDSTGWRTGQMLSVESLKGELQIGPDEMTMTYGTGQAATHGFDGLGFDPKTDGKSTDREKATYFEKTGTFYELNERREAEIGEIIGKAIVRHAEAKFTAGGNP